MGAQIVFIITEVLLVWLVLIVAGGMLTLHHCDSFFLCMHVRIGGLAHISQHCTALLLQLHVSSDLPRHRLEIRYTPFNA